MKLHNMKYYDIYILGKNIHEDENVSYRDDDNVDAMVSRLLEYYLKEM